MYFINSPNIFNFFIRMNPFYMTYLIQKNIRKSAIQSKNFNTVQMPFLGQPLAEILSHSLHDFI